MALVPDLPPIPRQVIEKLCEFLLRDQKIPSMMQRNTHVCVKTEEELYGEWEIAPSPGALMIYRTSVLHLVSLLCAVRRSWELSLEGEGCCMVLASKFCIIWLGETLQETGNPWQ